MGCCHKISVSLIFLLGIINISCKENMNIKSTEFYDFTQEGMVPKLEYIFYPFKECEDSASVDYDLYLLLRYSDNCNLKELPLNIEYSSLSEDSVKNMHLKLDLFDRDDKKNGKGNFGIFETECLLLKNQKYQEGFFISVSTEELRTRGVLSMGVLTELSKK